MYGVLYSCGPTGRLNLSRPYPDSDKAEHEASELRNEGYLAYVTSYPSRAQIQFRLRHGNYQTWSNFRI